MSADNWAMCPRCRNNRRRRAEVAHAAATAAYGVVSVTDFDALRAEANRLAAEVNQQSRTFREDYEIGGAEEGEVYVSYSGGCSVCGLTLKFEHHHRLDVEEDN